MLRIAIFLFQYMLFVCADQVCSKQSIELNNTIKNTHFTSAFTFTNDTRDSMQISWSDDNSGVILLVTTKELLSIYGSMARSSEVYRSTDNGVTFQQITSKLDNGNHVFVRKFLGLQRHKLHKKKMYLVCYNQQKQGTILMITEDGGEKWEKSVLPFTLSDTLVFHPSLENHNRILGIDKTTKKLYATEDGGRKWRLILSNVELFAWSDDSRDGPNSIYASVSEASGRGQDPWFREILDRLIQNTVPVNKLQKSTTLGSEWSTVMEKMYAFSTKNKYLYVSTVHDTDNGRRRMMVSTNGGKSFDSVQLPDITHDRFFSILDIEDDMVFMHVDDPEDTGKGKLYVSDSTGIIFSLSLENHLFPNYVGVTDFYRINSMRGTYITSQINNDGTMHSLISFNRGAEWQQLRKPVNVDCSQGSSDCHLQITNAYSKHMNVKGQLPMSTPNAVGIILAHGHAADKLKVFQPDVFVSSDGGYTWRKALDGPHNYQIADHGSLLVAVPSDTNTPNVVKFSTDEGQCWHTYRFTEKKELFAGLLTEPGNKAMTVAIYGFDLSIRRWLVHIIDFSKLIPRQCNNGDYEEWYPHSEMTHPLGAAYQGCLLGAKETFLRLKSDSLCANGYSHEQTRKRDICPCTKDDYECEYGFSRLLNNRTCTRNPLIKELDVCIQGIAERIRTSGYRKIPGDICEGGFQPDVDKQVALNKKCDNTKNLAEVENNIQSKDSSSSHNVDTLQPSKQMKNSTSSVAWVILALVILCCLISGTVLFVRHHQRKKRQAAYKYSLLNDTSIGIATGGNSGGYGGVTNSHGDVDSILGSPALPPSAPNGFLVASRPDPRYLSSSFAPPNPSLPSVPEERRRKGYHDDSDVDLLE